MPTRVQQAQGNGAIVQAANQLQQASQNASNRAQASMGAGATEVPTISAYWKTQQPDTERAIMSIGGFDMAQENRDKTANIGTSSAPFVSEVDANGNPKPFTPGGGLTQKYHSGISEIFDRLERSGVSADPGMVRAVVRDFFKPENRASSFSKTSIFNDPAFYQVANQHASGGNTKLDNTINAIADYYSTIKRQRDAQFNVRPTTATRTVEATVVTPAKSTGAKVRVSKK